jgi:hypothetical protein
MGELTEGVNWLAVIVGAIAAYGLGWLWYSPKLFGTKWMEGSGVKMEAGDAMPVGAMVVQAIGTFLLAWVVGITETDNALMTIILIAVTIAVIVWGNGLFAQKSTYAIATEAGYVIAMVVVMVVAQGLL